MQDVVAIPPELLESAIKDSLLVVVGPGIHDGIVPSFGELTQDVAVAYGYPPDGATDLPDVAEYYAGQGRRTSAELTQKFADS